MGDKPGRRQHRVRPAQGPAAVAQQDSPGHTHCSRVPVRPGACPRGRGRSRGQENPRAARDAASTGIGTMHILSLRRLREFWAEHPDAEASLRSWYRVAKQARWQRFTDVRAHYRGADQVGKFTVFNIAGNAYRLITVIHFNTGRVYVRRVLTHAAYTRGTWQDD